METYLFWGGSALLLFNMLLLFVLVRRERRLQKLAGELARRERGVSERANEIIRQAQETAVARLRASSSEADQLLAQSATLGREIKSEVEEQLDTVAQHEKALFARALAAARRTNDRAWEHLNQEVQQAAEQIGQQLRVAADSEVKQLAEQLKSSLNNEIRQAQAAIKSSLAAVSTDLTGFVQQEEGLLKSRVEAHAETLAREVLRRALTPQEQNELVTAVLAEAQPSTDRHE